jgi:hypothetical protein
LPANAARPRCAYRWTSPDSRRSCCTLPRARARPAVSMRSRVGRPSLQRSLRHVEVLAGRRITHRRRRLLLRGPRGPSCDPLPLSAVGGMGAPERSCTRVRVACRVCAHRSRRARVSRVSRGRAVGNGRGWRWVVRRWHPPRRDRSRDLRITAPRHRVLAPLRNMALDWISTAAPAAVDTSPVLRDRENARHIGWAGIGVRSVLNGRLSFVPGAGRLTPAADAPELGVRPWRDRKLRRAARPREPNRNRYQHRGLRTRG